MIQNQHQSRQITSKLYDNETKHSKLGKMPEINKWVVDYYENIEQNNNLS